MTKVFKLNLGLIFIALLLTAGVSSHVLNDFMNVDKSQDTDKGTDLTMGPATMPTENLDDENVENAENIENINPNSRNRPGIVRQLRVKLDDNNAPINNLESPKSRNKFMSYFTKNRVLKNKGVPKRNFVFGSNPLSPRRVVVELPNIANMKLFGDSEKYDQWFSRILYDNGAISFEAVTETEYMLLGKFMPASMSNVNNFLHDVKIIPDSESSEFSYFLERLRLNAEFPDDDEFNVERKREASKNLVLTSIGKASTVNISNGEIDNISQAPQRFLMSARDLFYYPGMLKLAAFFDHLFDITRSNGFFYQFVTTVYSGVYGPRRKDLHDIARIQNIPKAVISDNLIRLSLGYFVSDDKEKMIDEASKVIGHNKLDLERMWADTKLKEVKEGIIQLADKEIRRLRQNFVNTDMEELIKSYGKDELYYKELDPVPKTVEDVLDTTAKILTTLGLSQAEINANVYDETKIEEMQNFYLTRFDAIEIKELMDAFLLKLKKNPRRFGLKADGGAYMYAAFILISEVDDVTTMISKLDQVLAVEIAEE